MLNISVINTSSHRRVVREGESASKTKLLTEAEATKQLDRIAPDWPLHLYDGVVIDDILKVVNQARTSVQKSCDATVPAAPQLVVRPRYFDTDDEELHNSNYRQNQAALIAVRLPIPV